MKQVTLRAFCVQPSDLFQSDRDLFLKLKDKLKEHERVTSRRMRLSSNTNEEDVLAYYDEPLKEHNSVFCTIVRIVLGNMPKISSALLDKKSFTLADLKAEDLDVSALYKSDYSFRVSNNFIVTNLPSNFTISRLQTYLNWFLDDYYDISPLIDVEQARRAADIRSITIQDPIYGELKQDNSKNWLLKNIGIPAVKKLFNETKAMRDLELESIISAKLVLEIDKPNRKNSAAIQQFYSAFFKPIADIDNIVVTTRDNQKILKGKDLLRTKIVEIDTDDFGNIIDQNLSQEMQKFILELENDKKNIT